MKVNGVKSVVSSSFRECCLGFRQKKRRRRYKNPVWPTASPVNTW